MRNKMILGIGLACLLTITVSCGGTTPACETMGSGGPGTTSAGPVTIATDHEIYAPDDTIRLDFINQLGAPIHIISLPEGDCLFFELDAQQTDSDSWVRVGGYHCFKREAPIGGFDINIPADASYTYVLDSSAQQHYAVVLEPGNIYRISIDYISLIASNGAKGYETANSDAFRVCMCRMCA